MLNIIFGILLFFFSIFIHETMHYITLKYFNGSPKFKWINKGKIKIFGGNPGVTGNINNPKEYMIVLISPIPICFVYNFLMFILFTIPTSISYNKSILWILLCLLFSFLITLAQSWTDIEDLKKIKKL